MAGGSNNQAGYGAGTLDDRGFATVGGGFGNRATGGSATVAGGYGNTASGEYAAVGGGRANTASGDSAAVGGGEINRASGWWATVGGGFRNTAGGSVSFAAGRRATVRTSAQSGDYDGDEGTFAWGDSTDADFQSTGPNQFLIRAAGGVGINTNAPSPGGLTVAGAGKLTFGSQTRQMIDLYDSPGVHGIGVQFWTHYCRTDAGFAWFKGGTHADATNDPGPGGTLQMRLDADGNLFVRGTVNPGGADFAEMLPAERGLEPGDVLAIGADGQLTLSSSPYQDSLAGVYSTRPGLVGGAADGEDTEGKAPLAVAGVVPVKVTAENGAVRPGDLLTSSSTAGHAMRASRDQVVVGVVIGKALEGLARGRGVVKALVVLQ